MRLGLLLAGQVRSLESLGQRQVLSDHIREEGLEEVVKRHSDDIRDQLRKVAREVVR